MKLSREAIQRMISQKPGTSNVTVINQGGGGGGGGGVILGPLLTSLNAEAMPSAEGYLHWSGTAWEWTTPTGGDPVDLTPYALKTWVQTNYASKDDIAYFITLSQAEDLFAAIDHTHDNYLPLSAGANKALTGSLYFSGNSGINWAGGVGMLCYMPSSGWTGISASQWGVGATLAQGVIRSNANDILHYRNGTNYKVWDAYNFTPSDYLPLTGGTVESLTVTNDLDADSITVGSLVNSETLAEYLDADAMQTWLQQQGYITQTTADGRYLPLTGGSLSNDLTIASNKYLRFGSNSGGLLIHNTTNGNNSLDISANRINLNVENGLFYNGNEVSTHSAIQNEFVAKAGSSMTGALSMGNGINVNFGDCSVTSNGSAQGNIQAGKILKLMGNYVAVTAGDNADANFTVNGNIVATRTWVGNGWKVKNVEIEADNGLVLNGEDVISGAELGDDGTLTLHQTRLSIAVPETTSDLVNDSGFIDQTTADGRYIKGVSVYGSSLTPDANRVVNIPYADINTPGVIQIGTGLVNSSDDHTEVDTSVIASRSWANGQFITAIGVSGDNLTYTKNVAAAILTVPFATDSKTLRNFFDSRPESANNQYGDGKLRHYMATSSMTTGKPPVDAHIIHSAWDNTGGYDAQLAIGNSNSGLFFRTQSQGTWQAWKQVAIIDNLNTLGDNLQTYVNTQLGGYLPLTAGSSKPLTGDLWLNGNLVAGNPNNTTNDDSAKIAFYTNKNYPNISPYIQAINEASYGRKRLSVFQKNAGDWNTPQTEVLSVMPDGTLRLTQAISFKGTKATKEMIAFIDNKSDQWGNGIAIGGGGATIIGGGESAVTMIGQLPKVTVDGVENINGGSEVMYIGNDTSVSIFTNLGTASGWANRKEFFFDTGGSLSVPFNVVSKAPNNSAFRLQGANYDIGLHLGSGGTNRGIYEFSPKNNWLLYFDASNTILNYGNVGIGTASPAYKLDVNEVIRSTVGFVARPLNGDYAGFNNEGITYMGASASSAVQLMDFAYDSTNNIATVKFPVRPQVKVGTDWLEVVVAKSDENGIEFRGSEDGTYTFGYGSGRGDIYAGAGDFTGNLTAGNRPSDADQKLYVGGSAVITGNVGIGTRPTSTYAVEVDGSVYVSSSVHADSFVNNSDIRMKDVTRYIEPSVHDIAIAPIIEFAWKKGDSSKNLGTIAQYWQTVFPQAVHEDGDGMLSIEYANIALASAITAARHSLDNERRIAELEQRVAELEDELAAMVSQHSETTDN